MVSVLSVSAFADFTSTDSSHLNTLMGYNTYGGKSVARWLNDIWIKLDTYLPSVGQIEVASKSIASDVSDIASDLSPLSNLGTSNTYLSRLSGQFYSSTGSTIRTLIESMSDEMDGMGTVLAHLDARTISESRGLSTWLNLMAGRMIYGNRTEAEWLSFINSDLNNDGLSAAEWLSSIDSRLYHGTKNNADYLFVTQNNTQAGSHGVAYWAQQIFNLQNAEKQKEDVALGDYSSSGGRSASDTSSDVGAISGSLSNSFNSGVSASSALNAVDDNVSDFEYFFFGMHDDLNTASSGGSRAPARGSKSVDTGSDVPDFLSDYWGGLNG